MVGAEATQDLRRVWGITRRRLCSSACVTRARPGENRTVRLTSDCACRGLDSQTSPGPAVTYQHLDHPHLRDGCVLGVGVPLAHVPQHGQHILVRPVGDVGIEGRAGRVQTRHLIGVP